MLLPPVVARILLKVHRLSVLISRISGRWRVAGAAGCVCRGLGRLDGFSYALLADERVERRTSCFRTGNVFEKCNVRLKGVVV